MKKSNILLALFLTIILSANFSFAQLNGTYTINPAGSAILPNFLSFNAAISYLNTNGVSGPVTINVSAGTYTVHETFNNIVGSSAINTITIKNASSTKPILQYNASTSADNFIIRLDNTSNLVLNGFDFQPQNTTYGTCIKFEMQLSTVKTYNNISIINSNFTGNNNTNDDNDGIHAWNLKVGSWPSFTTSLSTVNNLIINNNVFTDFYLAIGLNGEVDNGAGMINNYNNITINNNLISTSTTNYEEAKIDVFASDNITINNNTITGNELGYGLWLQGVGGNSIISGNNISGTGFTGINYSTYLNGNVEIINNMINVEFNSNNSWQPNGAGIAISGSLNSANVYHNSVSVTKNINAVNGIVGLYCNMGAGSLNEVNNSYLHTNGGLAIDFPTAPFSYTINNNNYFSISGSNIANFNGTLCSNMAALRLASSQDLASINLNPLYISNSNLHLQANSPCINTGNNIATITTDIDAENRNQSDIGADEWYPQCVTTYDTITQSICQGGNYIFNNKSETMSGFYNDTLINAGGCDSILTLNLIVNNPITWYLDADADGYYVSTQSACTSPGAGYTSTLPVGGSSDCNDADATINAGATELNDNIDNNCNGVIDEGFNVIVTIPLVNNDPCSPVNLSANQGSIANCTTCHTAYDNGNAWTNGIIIQTPNATPPVGNNLVYYTGSTTYAGEFTGEPVPTGATAPLRSVWLSFKAPLIGGTSVVLRTGYTATNFATVISVYALAGPLSCAPALTQIGTSTTGTLTLSPAQLVAYGGQYLYVQLCGQGTAFGSYMMSIQGVAPTISLTSATPSSMRVNLPSVTNCTVKYLKYRTTGSGGYNLVTLPGTATSYTMTNLASATNYQVWCGYSNSIGQIFYSDVATLGTTIGCTITPPAASIAPIAGHCSQATATWPVYPNLVAGYAYPYRFYYQVAGSGGYNVTACTTNSKTISGLALNTNYNMWYSVICTGYVLTTAPVTPYLTCAGPAKDSNPTTNNTTISGIHGNVEFNEVDIREVALVTDNTTADGNEHTVTIGEVVAPTIPTESTSVIVKEGSFELIPNPAINNVTVNYVLPNASNTVSIQLLDIQGKVVKTITNPSQDVYGMIEIDLSNVNAGVYLVSVLAEGFHTTKKLIIEK